MKITKISLIDDGYTGMKVTYTGYRIKDGRSIPYERIETVKMPIPPELSSLINKTKVFLLWLTNYWEKKFDEYLVEHSIEDREIPTGEAGKAFKRCSSLMDNLEMVSITTSGSSILLSGKMQCIVGGTFAISTPLINEEFGFHLFEDMKLIVKSIFMKAKVFIESDKLMTMEPRDYLVNKAKMEPNDVTDLSDEEAQLLMIGKLEDAGCIVLKPDESEVVSKEEPKEEPKMEVVKDEKKKPVDKKKTGKKTSDPKKETVIPATS